MLSIAAVPFYVIAMTFGVSVIPFVFLLLNSTIIATSCVVIFLIGKNLYKSESIGFVLSLIFGVTSFIWPYISSMFPRPIGILFLMLGLYLILRHKNKNGMVIPFLAGLSLGLTTIANIQFFLLIPILTIFGIFELRKNKKQLIFFIFVIAIMFSLEGYITYFINCARFDFVYI